MTTDSSEASGTGAARRLGPVCATCRVQLCDSSPEAAAASGKRRPATCPMLTDEELLATIEAGYTADPALQRMAVESARTEAGGYCRLTRVEEIMDFARRMGWRRLGIAHCIGLSEEARTARAIFQAGGFQVNTVCCKVGSIDKESLGLGDADKVHPGQFEVMCNPAAQAALLEKAGCELNVVMGLCVGHDSMFFLHSRVPTTVLVVKDRVLGHNPAAALYTSHSYYRRLLEGETAAEVGETPAEAAEISSESGGTPPEVTGV